jgi:cobalt-zinc-cadmium efflux system protein
MASDHSHAAPGHTHGGGHAHAHPAHSRGRAFAIGISLNLAFVVIEALFGILSRSMALLADAGHNSATCSGSGSQGAR